MKCAWCNRERPAMFRAFPFHDLIVDVCSIKCAGQWNRWCRNKRMEPATFRDMTGKFVKTPVYKIGYFVRQP